MSAVDPCAYSII